jgi:hypothetical protein
MPLKTFKGEGKIFLSGDVQFSVREGIERHLFNIAKENSELAIQNTNRDDVSKMRIEMRHSIITIIMCYTVLEAISNNIFIRLTKENFDSREFKNKFDKRELKSKWDFITYTAYQENNKTKEKRTLPKEIKTKLDKLKTLRDQIIHYKPRAHNTDSLRKTSNGMTVTPELEVFTSEGSNEAIQTVRELLENFERITGFRAPKLD